jgi:hypothetical protein
MLAKVALIFVILARCGSAKKRPLIIGHRGSAGMYPEHTALSYRYNEQYKINIAETNVECQILTNILLDQIELFFTFSGKQ